MKKENRLDFYSPLEGNRKKLQVKITVYCPYCKEYWDGYMDYGDNDKIRCPNKGCMVKIIKESKPYEVHY